MKIDYRSVSRREFLLSSAGITIGVSFGVPFTAAVLSSEVHAQARSFSPNAWMTVGTDGIVTIISPAAEMGQGVMTAMPLLVAEEMDLDWSKVRVEQAPFNPSRYGNPMFGGIMATGASRTTQGYYEVMRLAGMQARYIMMVAAARKWGVPALEVTTDVHKVVHKASNRSMDYGEIASFAEAPAGVPDYKREHLKPKSQFRLIGKDLPRIDGRDKVTGKAVYGIDVRVPGMAYATLLRAPAQGEKPEKIDATEAKKVPGVKAVVPLPYGVGVIAESYPAAMKGKAALKVTWSTSARSRAYDTDKLIGEYTQRARNMSDAGVEYEKIGDPKAALSGAAARVSAEYVTVNVAQTPMEPMNCTALVEGDGIEIWAPMQAPSLAFLACTMGLGFKPPSVKLNTMLLGGGFGRRVDADYVFDAGSLAKAMPGTPIKLIWSREDDIRHAKFRPLVVQHLTAGLDAKGNMVSLHHRIVSESIYARANPPLFAKAGGRDQPVCEGAFHLVYGIPHRQLDYLREQRGIDAGFWRGVGPGYTKFAIEALIDQIAAGAGRDPLEYRMALLAKQPRGQAVLQEVARMSEWTRKRPEGRALGIAYSDTWSAHIAEVAEVSVDRKTGRIRVHDVWCAVDCGVALQPKNIEAQIEGAVVFGLSCCLGEQVTIKGGEVQQSNFHDYRILRMNETPRVHVKILEGGNAPSGIGEVGLPPIAPAVAGAVAVLTGKRLRSLPFDQAALKA